MMSSDDPPRLPKWAFLLGDGTLLATAAWIAAKASHPTAGGALVAIVSCVALAAVFGAIPFLADYGRQQEAALVERQRALSALAQTVETCAEQISIAAGSLQRLSEAAVSRAQPAEENAPGVHPPLAELQAQLLRAHEGERAKLSQLEAAVTAAAASVERIGTALTARIDSASAQLEAKIAAGAGGVAPPRSEATHPPEAPLPAPVTEAPLPAAVAEAPGAPSAEVMPPPAETTAVPPPRKRAPRKPPAPAPLPLELAVEGAAATASAPVLPENPVPPVPAPLSPPAPALPSPAPVAAVIAPRKAPEFDPPARPEASAETAEPEDGESALAADGATRVLVTAYIGIGNRLFIRGEGPGLTWERGVPLQFVSIGKWRWETAEATAPVTFRLYKNDETECTALGRRTLAPGRQQEFQAAF